MKKNTKVLSVRVAEKDYDVLLKNAENDKTSLNNFVKKTLLDFSNSSKNSDDKFIKKLKDVFLQKDDLKNIETELSKIEKEIKNLVSTFFKIANIANSDEPKKTETAPPPEAKDVKNIVDNLLKKSN
jgi:uncharacterized protein with von Willebrand factor type A (vWA) domain